MRPLVTTKAEFGDISLAIQALPVRQAHLFGAEGKQAQMFVGEALEQSHAGQRSDVVIQRHRIPRLGAACAIETCHAR
jgi:hypothetical protein